MQIGFGVRKSVNDNISTGLKQKQVWRSKLISRSNL